MASLMPFLNLTTLGLFLLLVFSYYLLIRSKPVKAKTAPEAEGGWPLIGHLLLFRGPKLPHLALADLADKYGPIFTIRMGIYPAVVVSSWEIVKEIFTTHDAIVTSRPKLTSMKLLGNDFANFGFSPYGEYWRALRKITASELMSNRRLELLKHVRASEVDTAVKDMYKLCISKGNEGSVEMKQWFNNINLNVILRMVASKRYFGAGTDDEHEARQFQKANREFFHLSGVFVVRDAIPWLGWLDIGGYEKAMKKVAKEVDIIMQKLLEEHRSRRSNRDSCEASDQEEQDFMDVLLTALDGIDLAGYDFDTVHKATAVAIISGASDTTTVNVTWALALLLNNPGSLSKVQEELDLHIGKERLVTESDIEKLVYLQAVIKETMRLYPVGPLSGRRVFAEDCIISGYKIPAGTRLLVNTHKLQRDPRVWSVPTTFKPERFLSTHQGVDVKGQHFELIPFGTGRRSCPGINFGVLMTQLLLARFLQAFEVSRCSSEPIDMTGSPGLTNSIATPLHVLVKPRLPVNLYH